MLTDCYYFVKANKRIIDVPLAFLALHGTANFIFKSLSKEELRKSYRSTVLVALVEEVIIRGVFQESLKIAQTYGYRWLREREATANELKCQKRARIFTLAVGAGILNALFLPYNSPLLKAYCLFTETVNQLDRSEMKEKTGLLAPSLLVTGFRNISLRGENLKIISPVTAFLLKIPFQSAVSMVVNKGLKGGKEALKIGVTTFSIEKIAKMFFGAAKLPNLYSNLLFAPVEEELQYRYFFHTQMKKIQTAFFLTLRKRRATKEEKEAQKNFRIKIGAIIFGGVHALNSHKNYFSKVYQVFFAAINGISFGHLFESTKSTFPGTVAHAVNNFMAGVPNEGLLSPLPIFFLMKAQIFSLYFITSNGIEGSKEILKNRVKKIKECTIYFRKKALQVVTFSLPLLIMIYFAGKKVIYLYQKTSSRDDQKLY